MSGYFLSPSAQDDLTEIADYYLDEAGSRVARKMLAEFVEAFRFLVRTPGAGHRREDLTEDPAILFWPMRDFLILYRHGASRLEIATIVRGSEDIPTILRRRGL